MQSNHPVHRALRPFVATLISLGLLSCAGGSGGSAGSAGNPGTAGERPATRSVLDIEWTRSPGDPPPPCVEEGYPCSMDEVEFPAFERAVLLTQEARDRRREGEELTAVAAWLRAQPGVRWVEANDGTLRFLSEGARPMGMVEGWRLDGDARTPPRLEGLEPDWGDLEPPREAMGTPGGDPDAGRSGGRVWDEVAGGAGGTPVRDEAYGGGDGGAAGASLWEDSGDGSGGWGPRGAWPRTATPARWAAAFSSPPSSPPAQQEPLGQMISNNWDRTRKPLKKALVLGLTDWEFGGTETTRVASWLRLSANRDYNCDDCVTIRTNDFPRAGTTRSPACIPEDDGDCIARFSTSWRDFLDWEDYDLIHLSSHGIHLCEDPARPGGRPGPCRAHLQTGWRAGPGESAMALFVAAQRSSGRAPDGIEYLLSADDFRTCPEVRRRHAEGDPLAPAMEAHDSPINNPESRAHQALCEGSWAEYVTLPFFREVYPGGLRDKVIVLNACEIFLDTRFVRHLASGGGTSVVGWKASPPSNLAEMVAVSFYAKILKNTGEPVSITGREGGNRVLVAWEEAFTQMLQGRPHVRSLFTVGPTRSEAVAGNLSPGQEDAFDKRVVELVHLVNTEEDRDVEDGDFMTLQGVAGDGRPDSLAVTVDVTGLEAHDDIDQFRLEFHLDGRPVPGSFPFSQRLSDESYRFEGLIPLGQDVRPGERVDLDVAVEIPGGGISRWLYEDLLLVGACSFTGRMIEIRIPEPRERFLAAVGEYYGHASSGNGLLTFRIENRPDRDTRSGSPDVRSFTFVTGPAAPVGTLGQVPAYGSHHVTIVRDNPYHNPRRAWNSTPIMNTHFSAGLLRPQDSGEFDLHVFTEDRLAGSLRLHVELAGARLLFEAEFDAGDIISCGEI